MMTPLPRKLECARPYINMVKEIAEQENISIADLAMAYIRDISGVTSLVVGCETRQQVIENIECINAPSLSQDAVLKVQRAFSDVPEIVLNTTKWTAG